MGRQRLLPCTSEVSVVVHGPGPQGALLSQNITNKAVISALFLTFNYPALFAAADLVRDGADEAQTESALFRAYFAFQLLSVVAAFCVMISAAIFVSHVLRCGQHVDSLVAYLLKAILIDNIFNEYTFMIQCGCTILAVQTYITLYFRGGLAWAAAGLFGLVMISLIVMLLWSTQHFMRAAQREWEELCEAETELRKRVEGSSEPGAEHTGEPGARGPRNGAALAGDGVGSGKGKEK
ncbi:hypothetical protein HYH03_005863 [Edaphochlamys debaryana]|uniref:Transmembrane protein n=1 Tax=Edaphochlamys debaryana TaxID=47281 RepID=A0A835Y3R7_9CHLO|nr:hypothetical protein HYH03_005863 [Edaphochlamys debaryana]|eukprot:KAG2495932.1 hypothetical protein HYH03_005863 [Edaphochlamys debaryana]